MQKCINNSGWSEIIVIQSWEWPPLLCEGETENEENLGAGACKKTRKQTSELEGLSSSGGCNKAGIFIESRPSISCICPSALCSGQCVDPLLLSADATVVKGKTKKCYVRIDFNDGQFSERCDVDGSFFNSDAIPIIFGKA